VNYNVLGRDSTETRPVEIGIWDTCLLCPVVKHVSISTGASCKTTLRCQLYSKKMSK